jgi:hypothetical protein
MSTGNIALDAVRPSEYMMPEHVSTSTNILRKQRIRFLPDAQVDYDPDGNNIIEFNIHDPLCFLLLNESYFVLNIYRSDDKNEYDYNASMDVGGIHAAIRNFEVYSKASNTRIHQLQSYNRMYALVRRYHIDKTDLNIFQRKCGDSFPTSEQSWELVGANINLDAAAPASAGGLQALTINSNLQNINLGDFVKVIPNNVGNSGTCYIEGTVTNVVSSSENQIISIKHTLAATLTTGWAKDTKLNVYRLGKVSQSQIIANVPERFKMVQQHGANNAYRCIWKPFSSFFTKSMPLFAIKMGLRFRIELERGGRCICTGLPVLKSSTEPKYIITKPRFIGMLSAPDASIVKSVVAQWNSPMGLLYYVPTYKYREATQTNTDQNQTTLNFHYGVRSAKGIAVTMQDSEIANGNGAVQYASNSISTNIRNGLINYQVQIGAHQFPVERVELNKHNQTTLRDFEMHENMCDLYYWSFMKNPAMFSESYKENQQIICAQPSATANASIFTDSSPENARERTLLPVATNFALYRDLSRSLTADNLLTGTDVSQVPLQLKLEFAKTHTSDYGFTGNLVYRSYLFHDAFIRLGSQITTSLE